MLGQCEAAGLRDPDASAFFSEAVTIVGPIAVLNGTVRGQCGLWRLVFFLFFIHDFVNSFLNSLHIRTFSTREPLLFGDGRMLRQGIGEDHGNEGDEDSYGGT